jgi:hypothetical protein
LDESIKIMNGLTLTGGQSSLSCEGLIDCQQKAIHHYNYDHPIYYDTNIYVVDDDDE